MPERGEKNDPVPAAKGFIPASRIAAWEWIVLAVIICTAAFLRFGRLGLIEFKADEANALQLALDAIHKRPCPWSVSCRA